MSTFDQAVQKADGWVHDMMRELGTTDPREAYHALAAALQTVRDRLSVDEAAQLAAQLPLLVRGLFYEGWHPASTPRHVRRPEEVIALFEQKSGDGQGVDPERALAATFEVLRQHVSPGELASLVHVLPRSLAGLAR
jgi:uncharacterized protein (DUF2267 family)